MKVHVELDSDERAKVAEARADAGAEAAVLQREQLADEEPGDGRDAEGQGRREDEHAEQRYPVVLAADAGCLGCVRRGGYALHLGIVVGVAAEARQGQRHEHRAGYQQGQPAHYVDEEACN